MMQSAGFFLLQSSHISLTTAEQHFLPFLTYVHPEAQPTLLMAQLWTRQHTAFGGAETDSYLMSLLIESTSPHTHQKNKRKQKQKQNHVP